MVDFKEINDPEEWELFSRDFFHEIGFYIHSSPDRGPDGKKDIIVTENLKGNSGNYHFKWLVSCKHFANREKNSSVKEKDEPNILERVKGFNCDGFIGFYSTISSSGLNSRLNQLKENNQIKDYRIFDNKLIENYIIRIGFSQHLIRYFPLSYKKIKPLHLLVNEYYPIKCDVCDKDLLEELYLKQDNSHFVSVFKYNAEDKKHYIEDIYFACKGSCNRTLKFRYYEKNNSLTKWQNIGNLMIPIFFLNFLMSIINQLQSGDYIYSDIAFQKVKHFIICMTQKVFREMTQEEKQIYLDFDENFSNFL
ncbi:MAG: restriction endonuclease [Ignavibacteria bacterium]|nr:restriction endonuclease [Ignavibacteria bacterium]